MIGYTAFTGGANGLISNGENIVALGAGLYATLTVIDRVYGTASSMRPGPRRRDEAGGRRARRR